MFDGKFLFTLIAVMVAGVAISGIEKKRKENNVVEGFMGLVPGGKIKPSSVMKNGLGSRALGSINTLMQPSNTKNTNTLVQSMSGGLATVSGPTPTNEPYQYRSRENFGFQVPANMQKMLSPRGTAESFGMGPNIRYNKPSFEKMAFQKPTPSQYGNMVKEGYTGGEQGCSVSGSPYQAAPEPMTNYAAGNFNKLVNSLPPLAGDITNQNLSNSLPVPTMESAGSSGEGEEIVNYNRMIIANPNSRTRSQGDMIRGDLVIAPSPTGWFRPSANPTLDLQQGALQVMAGTQPMDSNVSDGARIMASIGQDYYAGAMMNEQELSSINAMTDVQVMRLP